MARHKAPDPDTLDSWRVFTKKIFRKYDADPGYYTIMESGLDADTKARVSVAWCAFYNLGIAAKASEYRGKKFYDYLRSQFATAKRGSERRHFRGAAGTNALDSWQEAFPQPERMVDYITTGNVAGRVTYFDVKARCADVAMMGPYFTWKWCDLTEVLTGTAVDFQGAAKFSPKVPQEGAALIFPDLDIESAYDWISDYARAKKVYTHTGPVRMFGMQEAETVCCVYKQYRSGSYKYGSRTAKAIARLDSVPCDTSAAMAEGLLNISPWGRRELAGILETL